MRILKLSHSLFLYLLIVFICFSDSGLRDSYQPPVMSRIDEESTHLDKKNVQYENHNKTTGLQDVTYPIKHRPEVFNKEEVIGTSSNKLVDSSQSSNSLVILNPETTKEINPDVLVDPKTNQDTEPVVLVNPKIKKETEKTVRPSYISNIGQITKSSNKTSTSLAFTNIKLPAGISIGFRYRIGIVFLEKISYLVITLTLDIIASGMKISTSVSSVLLLPSNFTQLKDKDDYTYGMLDTIYRFQINDKITLNISFPSFVFTEKEIVTDMFITFMFQLGKVPITNTQAIKNIIIDRYSEGIESFGDYKDNVALDMIPDTIGKILLKPKSGEFIKYEKLLEPTKEPKKKYTENVKEISESQGDNKNKELPFLDKYIVWIASGLVVIGVYFVYSNKPVIVAKRTVYPPSLKEENVFF